MSKLNRNGNEKNICSEKYKNKFFEPWANSGNLKYNEKQFYRLSNNSFVEHATIYFNLAYYLRFIFNFFDINSTCPTNLSTNLIFLAKGQKFFNLFLKNLGT